MSTPPNPINTPPSTTLSTPSPTELHDTDPLSVDMPPTSSTRALRHIYLVVATTPVTTPSGPRLGIGLNGQLPWPMIKADMAYFRKVTTDGREQQASTSEFTTKHINSVIMGRKTYESIPPGFRPLSGRRNYIVTRSNTFDLAERYRKNLISQSSKARKSVQERYANSSTPNSADLESTSIEYREMQLGNAEFTAISREQDVRVQCSNDAVMPLTVTSSITHAVDDATNTSDGSLFCIGGGEIYNLLLQDTALRPRLRILQTEIQKLNEGEEYECDTFWPEELKEGINGWHEVSGEDAKSWTGIELPQAEEEWKINKTAGAKIRVRGWRQQDG